LNGVIPWTLIAWGERYVDAGLTTILNSASNRQGARPVAPA